MYTYRGEVARQGPGQRIPANSNPGVRWLLLRRMQALLDLGGLFLGRLGQVNLKDSVGGLGCWSGELVGVRLVVVSRLTPLLVARLGPGQRIPATANRRVRWPLLRPL